MFKCRIIGQAAWFTASTVHAHASCCGGHSHVMKSTMADRPMFEDDAIFKTTRIGNADMFFDEKVSCLDAMLKQADMSPNPLLRKDGVFEDDGLQTEIRDCRAFYTEYHACCQQDSCCSGDSEEAIKGSEKPEYDPATMSPVEENPFFPQTTVVAGDVVEGVIVEYDPATMSPVEENPFFPQTTVVADDKDDCVVEGSFDPVTQSSAAHLYLEVEDNLQSPADDLWLHHSPADAMDAEWYGMSIPAGDLSVREEYDAATQSSAEDLYFDSCASSDDDDEVYVPFDPATQSPADHLYVLNSGEGRQFGFVKQMMSAVLSPFRSAAVDNASDDSSESDL